MGTRLGALGLHSDPSWAWMSGGCHVGSYFAACSQKVDQPGQERAGSCVCCCRRNLAIVERISRINDHHGAHFSHIHLHGPSCLTFVQGGHGMSIRLVISPSRCNGVNPIPSRSSHARSTAGAALPQLRVRGQQFGVRRYVSYVPSRYYRGGLHVQPGRDAS